MSRSIVFTSFAAAFLAASAALAQAPAGAPAGATGACKDGSYTTAANKQGACRGHKGVGDWYARADSAAATAGSARAPSTDSAPPTSKKQRGHKNDAADAVAPTAVVPAAAAAAGAPPVGTTGQCKDGSYSTGTSKRGACRGHKGVKDWYTASTASTVAPVPAAAARGSAATTAAASAPAAVPAAGATRSTYVPPAKAAAGGGPGLVWANKESKVYHCQDDRWYGKTKQGEYLSEANAKAQGFRPDHGKGCQG